MSVVNSTKLAPELNYQQLDSSKSSPMFRKVYPANNGARTFNLDIAGTLQSVTFNIPCDVVNLGESFLDYSLTVAAQAANTYSWIYKDTHGEFDSLNYRDTGTQSIVDIKNLHLYQQIMNRLNTSSEKLAHNDILHGLAPTNASLADVKSVRYDGTTNTLAWKEPQQMDMVNALGVAAAASAAIQKRVYLKDLIPDSYFGLAKNGLLPVETYMDINFSNGAKRIGYTSISAVNPADTPATFTQVCTITNICLNLCYEQNQDLVAGMKKKVAAGLSLPLPFPKYQTLQNPASAAFNHNVPLDAKSHGRKVKRIIYAPLSTAAGANLLYDHSNVSGAKISQYHTELDNAKLQRDILNVSATVYDDYMNNRSLLKGSCYFNQPIFNQNWIHVDSWSYDDKQSEMIGGGAIMTDGLVLDKPMTYSIIVDAASGAQFNNATIICGLKQLNINSSSFVVI